MSSKLEFFYDYVSLYSYLADSQMKNLPGVEIVYRPMLLGAVMKETGNWAPGIVKAKGKHLEVDARRWAERYGIPMKMNPVFPQNTVKALRLALVALGQGGFDAVHKSMFDAMWVNERNLDDQQLIAEIAAEADLSASAVEDSAIKDALKANTAEAVERGVFGAPTFFVGDEMFFGNDRFEFIREALGIAD